jgi:hypothetical protein
MGATILLTVHFRMSTFSDSTCERDHVVLVFLCVPYFTWYNDIKAHASCHKWQDPTLGGGVAFQCGYAPHFLYSFTSQWPLGLFPFLGCFE